MSGQKLKVSHKVAAFLERMLRDIRVKDLNIDISLSKKDFSLDIPCNAFDSNVNIEAETSSMDTSFNSRIGEMEALVAEEIKGIKLEDFSGNYIDVNLKDIIDSEICDLEFQVDTEVNNYFDSRDLKLKYKASVEEVEFKSFDPSVLKVNPILYCVVKENLFLLRKLKVKHSAMNMVFAGEKLQLRLWRKAVLTTRKDPKKLELKGIFAGVPVDSIEKLSYDGIRSALLYSYKQNFRKNLQSTKNVAVFKDVEKNERVVIID